MAHIFDGKKAADSLADTLRHTIESETLHPVLATVLVGNNPASELYVKLKQKRAEAVGIEMDIYNYNEHISVEELTAKIEKLNKDHTVHGIMVQLPLPGNLSKHTSKIVNTILLAKDVDGMRENSPYLPATLKAVIKILDTSKKINQDALIVVVGSKGMVGKQLVKYFSESGYEVIGLDMADSEKYIKEQTIHANILISSTGTPGLITEDHVKKGAVVIDVGSPKPDVLFNEVMKKASFITPVPGGVGPMTIVALLENVVLACNKQT